MYHFLLLNTAGRFIEEILKYFGTCRNRSDELEAIQLVLDKFLAAEPADVVCGIFSSRSSLLGSFPIGQVVAVLAMSAMHPTSRPRGPPSSFHLPISWPRQRKISRKGTLKMSYSGEGGSPA